MLFNIQPDWSSLYSASEAEAAFPGFKFKGPGWYVEENGDTFLVVPFTLPPQHIQWRDLWKQTWPKKQNFYFMFYSNPPFPSFNAVANAPTRSDLRK